MKTIKFNNWECSLEKAEYGNGRLALMLMGTGNLIGQRIAVASLNLPDVKLGVDEIIIKDYSQNKGMVDALVESDIIETPHRFVSSGYVEKIPICKLR